MNLNQHGKKIKISIICYLDIATLNAESIQVMNFAQGLKESGNEVEIIAPAMRKANNTWDIRINCIPVVNVKLLRPLSFLIFSPFYIFFHLLRNIPDAVICFDIYNAPFIIPAVKALRLPVLLYLNSIISEDMEIAGRKKFLIWLVERCWRMNVRLSNMVAVVAEPIREYLMEKCGRSPEDVEVVRDAADADKFGIMDRDEACKVLSLDLQNFYVGFVGSLCPWHGVDYLVRAMPLIAEKNEQIRFLIVGDGRMKDELVNLADSLGVSDKIIWTGFVPYKQVPLHISAFDTAVIFFKPMRRNYGSPMKIFEYLSCGKPVIASKGPEYGDFIEELNAGISLDPEDTRMLAEEITKLAGDRERLAEMSGNARNAIIASHTWEKRAEQMESLLRKMLR